MLPCGLASPSERNIPEQGKMFDINLFLLPGGFNLPKEWLGFKSSCDSSPLHQLQHVLTFGNVISASAGGPLHLPDGHPLLLS